jgi:hypothetical protein
MKVSRTKEAALSAERLRELFDYDPEVGDFVRKVTRKGRRARIGAIAGADTGQGYIAISIGDYLYKSHRLAFLYMLGRWPLDEVDHINGVRNDNRWRNLREVTSAQNTHNQRAAHRNNSTGYLGVKFYGGSYRAAINFRGRRTYIGSFDTGEAAHAAYVKAKQELHESCTL